MKIKNSAYFVALAFAAGLSSCNDDTFRPETADKGSLNTASILTEVKNAEIIFSDNQSSVSRSTYTLGDFIISVKDEQGVEVANWNYGSMPSLPTFPVGKYTVQASSGEVQPFAWETPHFTGSQSFEIVKNQVTDVETIVCKLANICVSVHFSDKLLENCGDDVLVTVTSTESANSLSFDKAETRKAYFEAAGQETFEVHFTGTVMGNHEDFKFPLTNVAAGQHRKINFALSTNPNGAPDEFGNINYEDGGINVAADVEGEDLTSDTPHKETPLDPSDRPGKEDPETPVDPVDPNTPDNPDDPSEDCDVNMTSALEFDTPIIPAEGLSGIVNIHCDSGLAHLYLDVKSTNEEFAGIALGLFGNGGYDFAYPPSEESAAALGEFGLDYGDMIIDKEDVIFNISTFIPMLDGFKGEHIFKLTVESNAGDKLSKSLIFTAK